MAHLRAKARFALRFATAALRQWKWGDDELFLRVAYNSLLKRQADCEGLEHYKNALRGGKTTRRRVLNSLLRSQEYRVVYGIPLGPGEALHIVRLKLVHECLPPARKIVDLGGASNADQPEGALLAMGYPHRPCEVLIVDLPPVKRLTGITGAESVPVYASDDGAHASYLYQSMAQPLPLEDGCADMVFSGESIEHVTETEADLICEEAFRILKPGGHFCLDTPNAALTRLESPNKHLHPEHRKEYQVPELRAKLERAGFTIVQEVGICPMPETLRTHRFDSSELVMNCRLSETPEESYLFYLHAMKADK